MLCTMCMFGISLAKCWVCGGCGAINCPHIHKCKCGVRKRGNEHGPYHRPEPTPAPDPPLRPDPPVGA